MKKYITPCTEVADLYVENIIAGSPLEVPGVGGESTGGQTALTKEAEWSDIWD